MRRPGVTLRARLVAALLPALLATALPAGHARADAPSGPCALRMTNAWLSEGVTPWDAAHVRPLGTVNATMIFVRFPGHTPRRTPQQLAANYLPSVPQFYAAASYGKAQLAITPVLRYFTLPTTAADYGIHRGGSYPDTARYLHDVVAAVGHAVDFAGSRLVYVVADPDAPGVDHDATSATMLADRDMITADGARIRNVALIWEADTPDRNVVAHETGHLFGLPDLYVQPEDPLGDWDTMAGDWDLMADQRSSAPEFLAWEKWKFGWLDSGQVDCVAAAGTTRHTLTPTELTGGTKLVVIKRGETEAYAVEARSPYGNDRQLCAPGVLVYRVRTDVDSGRGPVGVRNAHPREAGCPWSVEPSMSKAAFRPGERYTADDGEFRLRVVNQDADGNYAIEVTVGPETGSARRFAH